MNNSTFCNILCTSVLVFASTVANAVLIDRGGRMIYDSDSNLTWIQDTNMAISELTDERVDEILAAVDYVDGHLLETGDFKYYQNGKPYIGMSWYGAIAWAGQLEFGGFDDWRLPTTPQKDPTCIEVIPNIDYLKYYNCTGGEMGNLWYNVLGNTWGTTRKLGPFYNIYSAGAWTSTKFDPTLDWTSEYPHCDEFSELPPEEDRPPCTEARIPQTDNWHWLFYNNGNKFVFSNGNPRAAWAVRDNCGFNFDLLANRWTMISLPCAPVETVNTVEFVFGDDLDIAQYGNSWVVYEWDAANNTYTRLETYSILSQNKGYWILSLNSLTVDSKGDDTQALVSISEGCAVSQGCYEITLVPPADGETEKYNMIGHVFPSAVPWADVRIKTVEVGGATNFDTPSEAADRIVMDKTYWRYNGGGYDPDDDLTTDGQLAAFDGFWVRTLPGALAMDSITLLLPKPAP